MLYFKNGKTIDIQKVIFKVNKDQIWKQTREFSKQFEPTRDSLRQLWRFVKYEIDYEEDPSGKQFIQHPSRLWWSKEGDCKSFTIFIVSVLQNLGIPYTIRFTSYESGPVTHVYPIAHLKSGDVILDAVWTSFDSEKTYFEKQDHKFRNKMAEIYELKGLGSSNNGAAVSPERLAQIWETATANIPNEITAVNDVTKMSEVEFYQFLGYPVNKIGSVDGSARAFSLPIRLNNSEISGIGKGKVKAKAKEVLKKVGEAAKKVVTKLADLWAKLLNWLFKGALQKAASYFIFIFLKKGVSPRIAAKIEKQKKILDWICKAANIDRQKVDATLRAAIAKQYGKQPEDILNSAAKSGVAGIGNIGVIPVAAIIQGLNTLKEILTKVFDFFKSKKGAENPPVADQDGGSDLDALSADAQESGDEKPAGNAADKKIIIKTQSGKANLPRQKEPTTETNNDTSEPENNDEADNSPNGNSNSEPKSGSNTPLMLGIAAVVVLGVMMK